MDDIYIKYSRLIYNYLYGLTNDIELSEELMQETFYSAIKGINKFKEKSKITVWLCQIAKNKWKKYLIKNNKIKFTYLDDNIQNLFITDDFIEQLNEKDEIIQLYKCIDKLDRSVKEVFQLRIIGELSFKEIGEIIGKSEEWARVTFYRGKIKIKEDLLKNER